MTTISVAEDFSLYPAGRFPADYPYRCGQLFRQKHLIHLRELPMVVNLDGTAGWGSSWLEEAFGGLVRHDGFTEYQLRDRLAFISADTSLVAEIWQYIADAQVAKDAAENHAKAVKKAEATGQRLDEASVSEPTKPLKPGWFQRGLAAAARKVATWPRWKQEAMQTSSEEGLSVVRVEGCANCPARHRYGVAEIDCHLADREPFCGKDPDWCPLRKGPIRLELVR